MLILIAVIAVLLVGLFFLVRSPSSGNAAGTGADRSQAEQLRALVLAKLQDRLVGWNFEPMQPDAPLEIVAVEAASERRQVWNIGQLFDVWLPLQNKGLHDQADGVVEDFVLGSTGTEESEESSDISWIRSALALKLVRPEQKPKLAFTRPAGALLAVLVLRSPGGAEVVTLDDLEAWSMSEADAFQTAYQNLADEVADGLTFEPLDEAGTMFAVAPGDPLATSYTLVPKLADAVRRRFKQGEPKLFLNTDGLVVGTDGFEQDEALLAGPQPLDVLVWTKVPAAA